MGEVLRVLVPKGGSTNEEDQCPNFMFSCCSKGQIRLWHLPGMEYRTSVVSASPPSSGATLQHPNGAAVLDLSFTSTGLVAVGGDGGVTLWDVETCRVLSRCEIRGVINCCIPVFGEKEPMILCGGDDGALHWLDMRQKHAPKVVHRFSWPITSLSVHGHNVAVGGVNGSIDILEVSTFHRELLLTTAHSDVVGSVHFTAAGTNLISCGLDGRLCVWDTRPFSSADRLLQCHSFPTGVNRNLTRCSTGFVGNCVAAVVGGTNGQVNLFVGDTPTWGESNIRATTRTVYEKCHAKSSTVNGVWLLPEASRFLFVSAGADGSIFLKNKNVL